MSTTLEAPGLASPPAAVLGHALEHASHLVPAQSPLDRFVHHNPLHHFEEERFEDAVVSASEILGTQPFWAEDAYRRAYATGRIRSNDLEEVLEREVAPGPVAGIVERRELTLALMRHAIRPLAGAALEWTLTETDALTAPRHDLTREARARLLAESGGDAPRAMRTLWSTCDALRDALPAVPVRAARPAHRIRDRIVAHGLKDPDTLVHPVLIRWSAGYLDHGVAYWPMSGREKGFFHAFVEHFSQAVDLGRPWLAELRTLVHRAKRESWTAEQMALHALEALGHPTSTWDDVVLASLLALRGWSGMFQRLHDRPDVAPEPLGLPTTLGDMLAVRLALDVSAASWILGAQQGKTLLARVESLPTPPPAEPPGDPAWALFQLAQVLGIGGHALGDVGPERLGRLLEEAAAIDDLERRRLWHTAYERRFRVETLDAVAVHARRAAREPAPERRVQVSFCIDDREESMRRLLEEVAPWIETLGVAGNYGISMYYQGLEHGHPVALGPGGFEPKHYVREIPRGHAGVPSRSRVQGMIRHNVDVGSQTLLRGAMVTLGGVFSAVPLSLRLLAPKMHAGLTKRDLPGETDLELDRAEDGHEHHGLLVGFTLDEKVGIVRGTLRLMSMLRDFAPLIFSLGHGSKSMNNPHEAAHDCGACGGGRGGPNARVFARMANDPAVRARLSEEGIHIPEATWFVGGYHNTADDAIDLYDTDLVPDTHRELFEETRKAFDTARTLDALERCRKFESVPLGATPAMALEHVENRDEDLAQPRPEYGHCTNAICLVGRRAWSRGLFLDRRAFLCSYDPAVDPDGDILAALLGMVVPVGAGISLEYWFSVVDPTGYGCGTKLPHNITGLIGVMDGHQSDLRTGLPWQMVELHEPVRLLCVVEASTQRLLKIATENPAVGRLVTNGWVQVASLDPTTGALQIFEDGGFRPWEPERTDLPRVGSSLEWFRGTRGLLPCATIGGER
ncbi:MAG: DUF2309 domain-containing protein [Alphaproteobacteria bacterium]|nr:DUF2309 domain-containing protein [Alphaproteobacteria bacterium]